jgi:hypothetical protein
VRRRWPLTARVRTTVEPDDGLLRLTVAVANEHPAAVTDKDSAVRRSLLGAHLLVEAHDAAFVSLLEPPPQAAAAAARCRQHRCWPVLAGPPGTRTVLLGAPIILYDHPAVAAQSRGALFDATEIDEILTLRVMTMTDEEKAEARATDARAAAIIDHVDALPPELLERLHGAVRYLSSPGGGQIVSPATTGGNGGDQSVPWWDPGADTSVSPASDGVRVNGVRVARGSKVVLRPGRRRADAQDLFLEGRTATVEAVLLDVDGEHHLAVTLDDDPAADLQRWHGRYLYFAPDEVEPR